MFQRSWLWLDISCHCLLVLWPFGAEQALACTSLPVLSVLEICAGLRRKLIWELTAGGTVCFWWLWKPLVDGHKVCWQAYRAAGAWPEEVGDLVPFLLPGCLNSLCRAQTPAKKENVYSNDSSERVECQGVQRAPSLFSSSSESCISSHALKDYWWTSFIPASILWVKRP